MKMNDKIAIISMKLRIRYVELHFQNNRQRDRKLLNVRLFNREKLD